MKAFNLLFCGILACVFSMVALREEKRSPVGIWRRAMVCALIGLGALLAGIIAAVLGLCGSDTWIEYLLLSARPAFFCTGALFSVGHALWLAAPLMVLAYYLFPSFRK